jgi:hypothetical protein
MEFTGALQLSFTLNFKLICLFIFYYSWMNNAVAELSAILHFLNFKAIFEVRLSVHPYYEIICETN